MKPKMNYQRVNPVALGIGLGVIEGLAIFTATIVLFLQGDRGSAFLSKLFPFYSISLSGAFIGLVEGFIDGFIGGVILGFVYNAVLKLRKDN